MSKGVKEALINSDFVMLAQAGIHRNQKVMDSGTPLRCLRRNGDNQSALKIVRSRGFTLIELMIVVVIVAVLLVLAVPAYQDYIRKAKRADAMDALMTIQQLQERHRANNPSYTTDLGTGTGLGFGEYSLEDHYKLNVTNATSTGYEVTATAESDSSQSKDTGCTVMSITVDNLNPRGKKGPTGAESCWGR